MFGIGFPEFIFILAIAFVVLGPEKLYKLSVRAGYAYKKLKRISEELGNTIQMEINQPIMPENQPTANEEKKKYENKG